MWRSVSGEQFLTFEGTVFCISKCKMLLDEWHSITCQKTCIFQQQSVVMSVHHIYSTVSTTFLWLSLQVSLESENDRYHDLLQGSFKDTYRNMTYKHIMALKWVLYYCPGVRYVLKSDDDTFVNTPVLMQALAQVVHYSIVGLCISKPEIKELACYQNLTLTSSMQHAPGGICMFQSGCALE